MRSGKVHIVIPPRLITLCGRSSGEVFQVTSTPAHVAAGVQCAICRKRFAPIARTRAKREGKGS